MGREIRYIRTVWKKGRKKNGNWQKTGERGGKGIGSRWRRCEGRKEGVDEGDEREGKWKDERK